jgi:uncharacterized protein (TIGR02145 family)
MAKIKVITDFDFTRKKYGGSIIQQGRIAPTFRNNPATRQFRTPTQLSFNSFMMLCVRHWRSLSTAQKTVWNDWAELFPQPTLRNAADFVNGYELFIKRNYYKALFEGSEFTFMLNPSLTIYPADELTPVITVGEESISLNCTFARSVEDLHCFIFVSSSVSPGLSFGNTRWRFMAAIPTTDQDIDITDNFIGQFGRLPAVDDHLFVSVLFTGSDNGQFTFHDLIPVVVEPPTPPVTLSNYGYVYKGYIVNDIRNFAPIGWSFPTLAQIDALRAILDPTGTINVNVAGRYMKTAGTDFWVAGNDANNSSGFSAKGAGNFNASGVPMSFNQSVIFWGSTIVGSSRRCISLTTSAVMSRPLFAITTGQCVRLIKNDSTDPGSMYGNDGQIYSTVKIGSQVWMKESSKETLFRDGSPIPLVTNATDFAASAVSCRAAPNYNPALV